MIAVGMMDRLVVLFKRTQVTDTTYGGVDNIVYTEQTEKIWSDVQWKSGKIDQEGEQMQNNQVIEFFCRNGGVMQTADVEDYIQFESKKYFIDAINVIDGREKYLQVVTTNVQI
tara:strand:+ start:894 stop:1235 length:342 start_codon:yes stop_codon:yes gene_type:complete